MNLDRKVPPCSCGYGGSLLHRNNCARFVALVRKYDPPGLRVEGRKIVRETPPD